MTIDWSQMITPEMREAQRQAAELASAQAQARELLLDRTAKAAAQTAELTLSECALMAKAQMYDEWQAGQPYAQGKRVTYNGIVYEVQQQTTASEVYPPNAEGVLALYIPLSTDGQGTLEAPYVWIYGMEVKTGEYVIYNGTTYKAKGLMKPCTWLPGSDINVWEEISNDTDK